jgi:hypothetical protein
MGFGKRLVTVLVGSFAAFNLALLGIQLVTGGADPGGPRSSSYATAEDGVRAWADLLDLRGRSVVRLREPLAEAELDPAATLVVADPDRVDGADQEAVATFLAAGGRLVLVGAFSAPFVGPDTGWDADGAERPVLASGNADAGGARELEGAGRGSFDGDLAPGIEPLATDEQGDRVVAVAGPVAGGRIVAVADSSLVHNENLDRADNAAFALGIVGDDRPVVFAESVHGYGAASGLGALPARARATVIGLVLTGLVGMWCAGQRFGPPEDRARRFPPPRRAFVDAIAVSLARSGDPAAAVEPLRRRARQGWVDRLGPVGSGGRSGADGPIDPQAAAAAGLGADEVAALDHSSPASADLLALGRAAARLHTSSRPTDRRSGGSAP